MVMMMMMVMANQRSGQVDGEHCVHDPPLEHQLHLDSLLRLASIHQCECPVLDHILENKKEIAKPENMRLTWVRRVCDSMVNESGSSFTTDLDVNTNYVLIIDHSLINDQRPLMITAMNKTDLARCLTTSWTEHT